MQELYCGIDVHKDVFVGCIMNKEGKIVREHSFKLTKEALQSFFLQFTDKKHCDRSLRYLARSLQLA